MIVVTVYYHGRPAEDHQFVETEQAKAITFAMNCLLQGLSITFIRKPDAPKPDTPKV